jgi:hypothetical protein
MRKENRKIPYFYHQQVDGKMLEYEFKDRDTFTEYIINTAIAECLTPQDVEALKSFNGKRMRGALCFKKQLLIYVLMNFEIKKDCNLLKQLHINRFDFYHLAQMPKEDVIVEGEKMLKRVREKIFVELFGGLKDDVVIVDSPTAAKLLDKCGKEYFLLYDLGNKKVSKCIINKINQ